MRLAARTALAAWIVAAGLVPALVGPGREASGLAAQAAVDFDAAVEPEAVLVGEPFTLRLEVGQARAGEVRFPERIEGEALEQLGPTRLISSDEGRRWQAEYTLVAWSADEAEEMALPRVEVALEGAGGARRSIEPPSVRVVSVLPAEEEVLELRGARPFLALPAFPWWIVALAALATVLAWRAWRRRALAPAQAAPLTSAELALREFGRLRRAWLERGMAADSFYDGYEGALRKYAADTRGWAPSRELRSLGAPREAGLLAALRHSVRARFGRVRAEGEEPLDDIDAGEGFVRADAATAEPASADAERGPDPGEAAEGTT